MSEPVRFTRAYLEQRAQELEAQCAEYKRLGQQLERDSRSFFEQSCKNLKRAEKAETESAGWKAAMNVHAERAEKAERERDEWKREHDLRVGDARSWWACRSEALEEAAKVAEAQPYYPDTHTGMRQQWVKDQIAAKLRALKTGGA